MRHEPEHINALAREAAQLATPAERNAFLDRACGGDPELREAVERRLAQPDAPTSTGAGLRSEPETMTSGGAGAVDAMTERPGSTIGAYRLTAILGQGGFGTVFLA